MELKRSTTIYDKPHNDGKKIIKSNLLNPPHHSKAHSNDFLQENFQTPFSNLNVSVEKSHTLDLRKKKSPRKDEKSIECVYPSHIEVIEKIKKIKSLAHPLPFSPITEPPNLPYGKKSVMLQKKIKERLDNVEYVLPQEPYLMEIFLKRIKETERVIRQEKEFICKIRKFKPKIQLKHMKKRDNKNKSVMETKINRRNKTPITLSRTGIVVGSANHT
ncbi:hypothetical protein SteCoe_6171 [Stentor coeruleus]|uniref:Uncharacterized protein n=1 Tax=Stentor coeruleus TaxID=5963 RepID=A0A1R2CQN2_9CILI|nr:hypothetical protein SteCoe_6171 [Stentor coeruleus]